MKSFQDFRSEISIMELAASVGYRYDPRKGSKWPVLVNEYNDDKIIIANPRSTSNEGYFNPNDDSDKGTLIDFVKNRLGRDFPHDRSISDLMNINRVLYGFKNEPFPDSIIYMPTNKLRKQFTTDGLMNSLIRPAYLLSRNINRQTLFSKEFSGRVLNIKNGNHINVAFPFYDRDDEVVGIEKRSFFCDLFVEGSERSRSVWHSNIPQKLERIIIAESAIDAMSYHQLKPTKNALYVSIGGSLSFGQIEVINALKARANPTKSFKYVSATDNDKAGDRYDEKLGDWLLPERLVVDKPIGKDYNVDLMELTKSSNKINYKILKR